MSYTPRLPDRLYASIPPSPTHSRPTRRPRRPSTRGAAPNAGAVFDIDSLDITAGPDVAFAVALVRCGHPDELDAYPDRRLRLTVGLRKMSDRWVVTHEHHSFAYTDDAES
ncbi:nuclear transport factor 2 family protein [Williamsia muralis]|uniref:nuclear transport factor 2 family protein n=1 Tax=Williamsia marianensis TaxID=85044 RepID=UPI003F158941